MIPESKWPIAKGTMLHCYVRCDRPYVSKGTLDRYSIGKHGREFYEITLLDGRNAVSITGEVRLEQEGDGDLQEMLAAHHDSMAKRLEVDAEEMRKRAQQHRDQAAQIRAKGATT